jgi:D-glycero-alpha-D-manno-heptose-7-phosphate kinase
VIISKTPLRVSFVGGGTDLPDFCVHHGGAVVSTTIDKWIHVIVAKRFEGDIRVSYSRTEIVENASQVEHELVRESLAVTGLPRSLEIVTLADVPTQGTGLGSSSAVTVGLLNALYAYQGIYKSSTELAEEAAQIEIDVLGKPIGRQDQYAAAFGGFNLIEFPPRAGGVRVEAVICPPATLERLHAQLMLFYTSRQRSASEILDRQRHATRDGSAEPALLKMRDLAYDLRDALTQGDVDAVGPMLLRHWELKRSLAEGVSDPEVDAWHDRALEAGATGAKLLGAGGGGFLLVAAAAGQHAAVRKALGNLRETPFRFAARGTQIELFESN